VGVPTLVFDPQPAELGKLVERRHQLDQDRRDEVWEGVLHMIPPPSVEHERIASMLHRLLGPLAETAGLELTGAIGIGNAPDNYRVPDLVLLRRGFAPQWNDTAALVVEIVSRGDKTWEKLGFYAAHHVDELLIVDPSKRRVDWRALTGKGYEPVKGSKLVQLAAGDVVRRLGWA